MIQKSGTLVEMIGRHLWYEQTVQPRERVDIVIDNIDVEHPYVVRAPRPKRMVP